MPKTGLKAFVYSFSVSLFAIIAANRAFLHEKTAETPSINIADKNIVLFLKKTKPSKSPVKQIALNILQDIEPEASFTPPPQKQKEALPEIILANEPDLLEIPLEAGGTTSSTDLNDATQALVLSDVLYSPEKPLEAKKIEQDVIYTPEAEASPKLKAPTIKPLVLAEASLPPKTEAYSNNKQPPQETLNKRTPASETAVIPLLHNNDTSQNGVIIKKGNPQDLNQVALNSTNVPIHSMKEDIAQTNNENEPKPDDWKSMADSPWLIAKSGGSTKNQIAMKEFADKSNKEIKQALEAGRERSGVQVAAETVKNLIIPIPDEIVKDEDLTPKLAYPSSSEDASTEKLIDAKIKKQTALAAVENKELLTPIDDDEIPDITPLPKVSPPPSATKSKDDKKGIISALNSIFTSSVKSVSNAKEKAIARAQAKRSFKKRLAQTRPVSIMPTEIRLSFQPNRAEISGQTLRWVQAFATKAAEVPGMSLEIRIDGTSSMHLQQKRLNLLHNILTNKGVGYSQINTVFTTREPNSFILRTVSNENRGDENDGKRNKKDAPKYIQW